MGYIMLPHLCNQSNHLSLPKHVRTRCQTTRGTHEHATNLGQPSPVSAGLGRKYGQLCFLIPDYNNKFSESKLSNQGFLRSSSLVAGFGANCPYFQFREQIVSEDLDLKMCMHACLLINPDCALCRLVPLTPLAMVEPISPHASRRSCAHPPGETHILPFEQG